MKKAISLAVILATCFVASNVNAATEKVVSINFQPVSSISFNNIPSVNKLNPVVNSTEVNFLDVKIGKNYNVNEEVKISSESDIYITDKSGKKLSDLKNKQISVKYNGKTIDIAANNGIIYNGFPSDGSRMLGSDKPIKVNNLYRGFISFRVVDNSLRVVNHLGIEDYLKGVVPRELSASHPKEALKAQAICARTFALKNINKLSKYGYNLDDTTACQAYKGLSIEDARSNMAVDETRGIIAYYNNEIANTLYCASSGGYTANANEVWNGNPVNYLVAFADPYSLKYEWKAEFTINEITNTLNKNNINIGEFVKFNIVDKDFSGRNKIIEIIGTVNTAKVQGKDLRSMFGNMKIKSLLFNIETDGENVKFFGKGFGHGVGMSQYGAVEMAKLGKNYQEIMNFYFPGIILK